MEQYSRQRPTLSFRFGLPGINVATPREAAMKTNPERPCVLLVDDYPDARQMYAVYLEYAGFAVVQATNGIEALRQAVESRPDIILMDLSLPVMDGWEATRRLKADPRTVGIPVVALTGHALAGASDGAKQAGCDAFVTKPCLPEELVQEIRKVLFSVKRR
jgi:two-component system cell cycle response regulator DivK